MSIRLRIFIISGREWNGTLYPKLGSPGRARNLAKIAKNLKINFLRAPEVGRSEDPAQLHVQF